MYTSLVQYASSTSTTKLPLLVAVDFLMYVKQHVFGSGFFLSQSIVLVAIEYQERGHLWEKTSYLDIFWNVIWENTISIQLDQVI